MIFVSNVDGKRRYVLWYVFVSGPYPSSEFIFGSQEVAHEILSVLWIEDVKYFSTVLLFVRQSISADNW